ncbi:MAG TPA: DUF1236 domain-containing protein [Pseudolabrys sp.]|nr:DUF1236 domain-containing protein [Pseudolabrys sp.]
MRVRYLIALLATTAIAPVAAQAQYAPADAAAGAAAGGSVAGPVGAAAGAIVGGTVGAASDAATALFAPPPPPVVTYVEREDIPSVAIEREVVVGEPLPKTVILHRVPKYHYEYAVVNHRRVIVEPKTRRVVKIIE